MPNSGVGNQAEGETAGYCLPESHHGYDFWGLRAGLGSQHELLRKGGLQHSQAVCFDVEGGKVNTQSRLQDNKPGADAVGTI